VVWIGAIVGTDWLRSNRVDTWSGPDTAVQSGVNLAGCPFPATPADRTFPVWVRFGGRVYGWAELIVPIGTQSIPASYAPTGYTLGGLALLTVEDSPAGKARERVVIRNGDALGAAVYLVMPDCT
jgi:hypothetical protein